MPALLPHDVTGTGAPLLLVHAFPLDARMWQPQREGLAHRLKVITPDLAGFGRAGTLPGPESLEAHANDLVTLLDHLGLDDAHVLGLSMGGYIALALARRHPRRLRGLILADTRAGADSDEAKVNRDRSVALVETQGVRALVEQQLLPKLLRTDAPAAVRSQVVEMAASQGVAGVVAALKAMKARPDSTPVLTTLQCPLLVLVGQDDVLTPPDEAGRMAKVVKDARCEVLPGAAHLSNLENPDAFNRAVLDFAA
ncbi:MAG: alpha/beta fold hydrolase [Myxococcota bacterium]